MTVLTPMHASALPIAPLAMREADFTDIPLLIELVTSAYRGEASRDGWTTEADLLDGQRIDAERLHAELARPQSRILIAERGANGTSEPVACAHVCAEQGAGYFGMFAVRPRLQGAGLGKHVLAEAERIVREEWRLPAMRMSVIAQREELIGYYLRRGYRRTGQFLPFPYGDERFGIPRRDDLRFAILEKTL